MTVISSSTSFLSGSAAFRNVGNSKSIASNAELKLRRLDHQKPGMRRFGPGDAPLYGSGNRIIVAKFESHLKERLKCEKTSP